LRRSVALCLVIADRQHVTSDRQLASSDFTVTVQDFLNRYEIGATVGVGGMAFRKASRKVLLPPDAGLKRCTLYAHRVCCCQEGQRQEDWSACGYQGIGPSTVHLRFNPMLGQQTQLSYHLLRLRCFQVVDKSRYATGDNSLQREIQVLCKVMLTLHICCQVLVQQWGLAEPAACFQPVAS